MVKAAPPVKTRRNHWAGDTSLVRVAVGSNPTRNQILVAFDLASNLGGLDSSSTHSLEFFILICELELLSWPNR